MNEHNKKAPFVRLSCEPVPIPSSYEEYLLLSNKDKLRLIKQEKIKKQKATRINHV